VLAGAIDPLVKRVMAATSSRTLHILALTGMAAVTSAFMNNVGALALFMPIAMQSAARTGRSPSLLLMPLAFGSILGGLTTLIGTPPNIIVATYRAQTQGAPFSMFDFTPVGGACALAGVLFIALLGWRLMPSPKRAQPGPEEFFAIDDYIAEARVREDAPAAGKTLAEVEEMTRDIDALIIGLVRAGRHLPGAYRLQQLRAGDIVVIEAKPEELDRLVATLGLEFAGADANVAELLRPGDAELVEAVVPPRTALEGRTLGSLHLRRRFGVNLLAASRQGRPYRGRLHHFRVQAGDVLLLQGETEQLSDLFATLGCLPLAERGVHLRAQGKAGLAVALFAAAIACSSLGVLPLQIAFGLAVAALVVSEIMPLRELYGAIDWSVVVLLGAMIPIGGALETTGTTELIAGAIVDLTFGLSAVWVLVALMVVTMTLSDILNNAATAVIMAPIAAGTAASLGVDADPFLMAVAISASCAFLTPIGHQNNTLVMGPGGYAFSDYWRMGLPLEILIIVVAAP
jgi:di/tricarboxylate transporter